MSPPSILRRLLSWTLPDGHVRDGLIGDLDELYEERLRSSGRIAANAWYALEVLSGILHYALQAIRAGQGSRDLRFAIRTAARYWRLTIGVTVTTAVTVGCFAAALGVAGPVLLDPMPFPDAERLYRVHTSDASGEASWISWPTFEDLAAGAKQQRLAGYSFTDFIVTGEPGPQSILAARVTSAYLDVLGATPELGRPLVEADYHASSERVALLTHAFWQGRYGADPEIVGRSIALTGPPYLSGSDGDYLVIGVLPERFWPFTSRLDVILPLALTETHMFMRERGAVENLVSRLGPGTASAAASDELDRLLAAVRLQHGSAERVASLRMSGIRAAQYSDLLPRVSMLLISAALVLGLALVNVAGLLFVRAVERRGEMVVRHALGAGRAHLFRQSLVECLLLGVLGTAVGLAVAGVGSEMLRAVTPDDFLTRLPGRGEGIRLDLRTVAITGAISVMSFVVIGLSLGAASNAACRNGSMANLRARLVVRRGGRTALLGIQLALALALSVAAVVLTSNIIRLRATELGFIPDGVTTAWLSVDSRRYATSEQRADYYDQILESLRLIPGVTTVGGSDVRFDLDWQNAWITTEGGGYGAGDGWQVATRAASPGYFESMGIPLVRGRFFTAADADGAALVAIVSHGFAEQAWPGLEAIGRQVRTESADSVGPWLTVVGVVEDTRRAPHEAARATLYRPLRQAPPPWLYVALRTDPAVTASLGSEITRAVWSVDATQPVEGPTPAVEIVDESTAYLQRLATTTAAFGLVGLLIAFTGVYGVTAHVVQQSSWEIAMRKALGASSSQVGIAFLLGSARAAIPALVVGVVMGAGVLRVLNANVEGLQPIGTGVWLATVALFGALVVLATLAPVRRALRRDAATTLRAHAGG
jgi:predicted permease